jgi:hypothetical protein
MTVRRLDDIGDIATSGDQFISRASEIAQTVKTRLGLFIGEYFRDTSQGTPWFQQILGKVENPELRESAIKRVISQTQGVLGISSFNADFDRTGRQFTVSCSIVTEFGQEQITISDII